MGASDSNSNALDALLDLDSPGSGPDSGGNFLFPLNDQASLFNFHTPAGLGTAPLNLGPGQIPGLFGGGLEGWAGTGGGGGSTGDDQGAMDPGLLRSTGTDTSGLFSSMTPTADGLAAIVGSEQGLLQQTTPASNAAQHVQAARARVMSNVLYNMSFGGIQQLDGYNHGSRIMMPMEGRETAATAAAVSGAPALQPMLGMLGGAYSQPGAFPPISPLSPTSPFGTAVMAPGPATSVSQGTQPARVGQACSMCRRRKVRCDGRRPSCSFCQSKQVLCVYEPSAAGGRRRRRQSRASESHASGTSRQTGPTAGSRGMPGSSGTDQHGKQRRFDAPAGYGEGDGIGSSSEEEGSGSESAGEGYIEALSGRQANGYIEELSKRQIALPDVEDGGVSVEGMMEADRGGAVNESTAERHLRNYFEYFHPQHPVLHRHTFEKAVRDGTVSTVLWQAVQAIAARYGDQEKDAEGGVARFQYGKRHAEMVRALLPEATRAPAIEAIQALYLLSEHQFGMGDWLEGSSYWGTAVRMFNQLQLHMTDEAFQFPAYTSHLGVHESAVSPLASRQSPAHYARAMRRPTLNNAAWIRREMERRMRWALFESGRAHALAGGSPPLVTLEAGWVHMPCSDALWDQPAPRRAAEYERLLLHMGRYYVDSGGSLRIDMAEPGREPNRVASMLVGVRRRKNRLHLNAHAAIVTGQMTRARLALFRLFFPCRWPSQFTASDMFGSSGSGGDPGGGGGAPGPVVVTWDERLRRMRATVADIEAKLAQWRVYLESMFPLREREEGLEPKQDVSSAVARERMEYANYRFQLAALIIHNRSTVLQLHACLARRERKIRAGAEAGLDDTARQTLANHILPNQPDAAAMQALRTYAHECWAAIVRQACEMADLLESHWHVRPHSDPALRILVRPDWHDADAIKAKINADANLRRFPPDPEGRREVGQDAPVFFSHRAPPFPLLAANRRLLDAIVHASDRALRRPGAELALASSMNSNIHIETNANARDLHGGSKSKASRRPRGLRLTPAGDVDFGPGDQDSGPDPFRMQLTNTPYFLFLAAKALIMYTHQAKMSAHILARRRTADGGTDTGIDADDDAILPSSSVSVASTSVPTAVLAPPGGEDLAPPPQLRTLTDIRRMQDRLEVIMAALRQAQQYWMGVDYFVLCARKLRNMTAYGPWVDADPVSTDPDADLANEQWPSDPQPPPTAA
ncbi:hypothetical protein GGF46_004504 [Coemansia sp. RSA 552]|nr:hypothetical protein GGF46_004504 [Coemansia sp. RSA 552]